MKKIWLAAATAALFAAPAFAGTIDNSYNNTLLATNAKGETAAWFINADSSFTIREAGGKEVAGTWKLAGESFCATPVAAAESCFTYVDGKAVGDTWEVKDATGAALKVELKAGR